MRKVENREYRKCGVWEKRIVENFGVENDECGK